MVDTVLVDTSLLIEQQKRPKHASRVREGLGVYRFKGASSYSKLEFKNAWLRDLAYLFELCGRSGVLSISDVFDQLNRLNSVPAQKRRLGRILEILSVVFELADGGYPSSVQLERLRRHCKNAFLMGVEGLTWSVTHFYDGTRCARAREDARENRDGTLDVYTPQCTRRKGIHCAIHDFFRQHQQDFVRIADFAEGDPSTSNELREMAEHIRRAVQDPEYLCNDKHCRALGDAIIALDGKDMEEYAANNDKEWRPIASILGKVLYNPVTGQRYEPEQK